jgi:hypothetical protein
MNIKTVVINAVGTMDKQNIYRRNIIKWKEILQDPRYRGCEFDNEISLVCCEREVYSWEFLVRVYHRATVNEEGIVQSAIEIIIHWM